jgi:hypothetical protein
LREFEVSGCRIGQAQLAKPRILDPGGLNSAPIIFETATRYPYIVEPPIPVEELDLSIRAFHILKVQNMDFIDQIDLDALSVAYQPAIGGAEVDDVELDDPQGRKARLEIAEKVRRWRGDSGESLSPSRR